MGLTDSGESVDFKMQNLVVLVILANLAILMNIFNLTGGESTNFLMYFLRHINTVLCVIFSIERKRNLLRATYLPSIYHISETLHFPAVASVEYIFQPPHTWNG